MKITRRQLREMIKTCLTEGDVIPGPWDKKSETPGVEDNFFEPPGIPVQSVSTEDISSMIDKQLGQLVYLKGDESYRDDFLITLIGTSKTLRGNAIRAYLTYVSQMIRDNPAPGNVVKHPAVLKYELDDISDLLDDFFSMLFKDHLLARQGMNGNNLNLFRAASSVIDQLETIGYKP